MKRPLFIVVILVLGLMLCAIELLAQTPAVADSSDVVLVPYWGEGYLDAVRSVDGVTERGVRYTLTEIKIGDSLIALPSGMPFSRTVVESYIDRLLFEYRQTGHYFARITLADLIATGTEIRLVLTAAPGPVVIAGDLLFEGLTRTDPDAVRRYFPELGGVPITEQLLTEIGSIADEISYLSRVGEVQVRPRPGYTVADVHIHWREKPQITFTGVGGLIPDDPAGVVWNIDLKANNLFGDGREASVKSYRPDRGRTSLGLAYTQPVFWWGRDRLEFSVTTRDYRDQFYEFSAGGLYSGKLVSGFAFEGGLTWRRVEPSDETPGYAAVSVHVGVARSNADNVTNPSRGIAWSTGLTYTNRRYSEDSLAHAVEKRAFNETRARAGIDMYLPAIANVVLYTGIVYEGLETSEAAPPPAELFFVGGAETLRGYRTEQFVAQRTGLFTVEPRFRFSSGYLFLFTDAAYLNSPRENNETDEELFRYGFGGGLALLQQGRGVTLSLGWNKDSGVDSPFLSIKLRSDI